MYDFLYSDHERVASFLAQQSGVGALVGNEETATKSKLNAKKAGLHVGAISGSADSGLNWSKDIRLAYDPLWMNSAKLVELVSREGSEIKSGKYDYDQLITISGKLMCMDQALFGNLLKNPSVVDQIANDMDIDDPQRSSKHKIKEKRDLAGIITDFVNDLPLGVVFILFDGYNAFWFNVKREYLQLQSLDIPLKFPLQIGGLWHVAGVIDALPQDYAEMADQLDAYGDRQLVSNAFPIIAQMVVPLVGLFGRPADAFGLNPVIIHRDVKL